MKIKGSKINLSYNIWFYILSAALIICFWLWIFDYISQPSANEKLLITIIGNGFDDKTLSADLKKMLSEKSRDKIKSVTVENISYQSDYELTNALWARILDSNIIIVSEGYMLDNIGDSYFHPIDEKKYEEAFGKVKFYRENGTPYGIVLYDGQSNNKFSNYCHTENKCMLFLTYNSVNAGKLNENADKGSDFAVLTVEWLLSENGG